MPALRHPLHEQFCLLIVEGMAAIDAYRELYKNAKGAGAMVNCSKLLNSAKVVERLNELQSRGRQLMEGSAFLSVEEKRRMLGQMARFDKLKLFREDGTFDFEKAKAEGIPGWCISEVSVVRTKFGDSIRVKFPDPIGAIEADNHLAGHGKKIGEGVGDGDTKERDVSERAEAARRGREFLKRLRNGEDKP